ncbi:MAG: plastocyanin/azurin family copper-binding protein, partial [Chloroflexales bacterium]
GLIIALVAGSPGGAPAAAPPADTPTPNPGVPTTPFGPSVTTGSGTALDIASDGDLLAFNKTTLDLTAGTVYTLSFKNNSTAVQHNWVLVDGNTTVVDTAVAAAAAAMGKARSPSAAVPPSDTKGLLVALPITNAGESSAVTFKAPAAGTYIFLCTFPGHYAAGMTGQVTVK